MYLFMFSTTFIRLAPLDNKVVTTTAGGCRVCRAWKKPRLLLFIFFILFPHPNRLAHVSTHMNHGRGALLLLLRMP